MLFGLSFITGFCLLSLGNGFVSNIKIPNAKPNLMVRHMDAAAIQEIEAARTAFVLCFAGAVGSAAVGREAIPVTIREWKKTNDLKGKGKSLGGSEMEVFGYPEPIYTNDVMSILNNNMSVYDIVEAYPVEGALPGYLRYEALAEANPEVQPMAVRAVFDACAVGINKNQVYPGKAVQKMELFRQDITQIKESIQLTKAIGVSALVILLAILGTADYFMIYHLWHGWFPEWHGFDQMPFSLFDERGITQLASNFVFDVPSVEASPGAFPL